MKFDHGRLHVRLSYIYNTQEQLVTTEFYLSENKKEIIR